MADIAPKTENERFAEQEGFRLTLEGFQFIYEEHDKKLTVPVEMLMDGPHLWQLAKSQVQQWDPPFNGEDIGERHVTMILDRICRYVKLTGKSVQIV